MSTRRTPYPSDVSDAEWAFVAPYLALLAQDAGQRKHDLREVFNALRWLVRTGAHWRMLPHDLPPWAAVYQQTRRWMAAGCFESVVHDLRMLLREAAGRDAQPTAVILDGRTVQSPSESGSRAGYDGHKRRQGSKTHAAVYQRRCPRIWVSMALMSRPPLGAPAPASPLRWARRSA